MLKKSVRSLFRKFGYDITLWNDKHGLPEDFEKYHVEIIDKVRPYTITSDERIYALIESVKYVVRNNIGGSFVECGVFKGGSMMAVALTLLLEGINDRDLYLFDTFEGMPKPDKRDVDFKGVSAEKVFSERKISDVSSTWVNASLEDVKKTMSLAGYPEEKIHYIKGLVEETVPEKAPSSIALLRLDTDWYQSTIHELNYLYPLLSTKGILIIDDYGHFKGARQAVDEYFQKNSPHSFLHRLDYTGRLIIKDS